MEASEYQIMHQVEDTHWWYRALRRVLFHHMNKYAPGWESGRLLDGGCGTGATLARIGVGRGNVGIDLAPQALEYSASRGVRDLVRGTITALPFADRSFATVLSTSVLYHHWVNDVDLALCEFRRVLCDEGYLFLELPAFRFLASEHDRLVGTARRFTRSEITARLQATGFTVVRVTYWNTLLFPAIFLVRGLGIMRSGRDFGTERAPSKVLNAMLDWIMRLEFVVLRCASLPVGVSLSCVARKDP